MVFSCINGFVLCLYIIKYKDIVMRDKKYIFLNLDLVR